MRKIIKKNPIYKFLVSVKSAVVIILTLGIVSSVGTIQESLYDAETAQVLVYKSWYMMLPLIFLCIILVLVMFDRWPWKKQHVGFILAHIGIITMLFGAYLTQQVGVDGTLYLPIGGANSRVSIGEKSLAIYSNKNDNVVNLFEQKVEFLKNQPSSDKPFEVHLGKDLFKIVDHYPYAQRDSKLSFSANKEDPPAIRFQLEGSRANMTQWISLHYRGFVRQRMGPAEVIMAKKAMAGVLTYKDKNALVFWAEDQNRLGFRVFSKSKGGLVKQGYAEIGDVFSTGWMDFKVRIITYYKNSIEKINFKSRKRPNALTSSAIKVKVADKEFWLGANSNQKVSVADRDYIVSYGNRNIKLDFNIKLLKFEVGRYQGTMMPSSYASLVSVPGQSEVLISMNEPLKYEGYTFYQASFEEDEMGKPIASVLSVNKDPGRFLKYLGSFLIVLGSIVLFYFKKIIMKRV